MWSKQSHESKSARQGTVLILVAGVSALLASLSIAFLTRVRSDVNEMQAVVHQTQARIMLNAACLYILEASRIGWDKKGSRAQYQEAYGWIDVRDGSLGPRLKTGSLVELGNVGPLNDLSTGVKGRPRDPADPLDPDRRYINGVGNVNFPIGVPARFPMFTMKRPPFATSMRATYNPIEWSTSDNGRGYLRYPDPLPAVDNGSWKRSPTRPQGDSIDVSRTTFDEWAKGDKSPIQNSLGLAWFRIIRENTGAIFTVTCGSGATLGFRNWKEVQAAGETQRFGDEIIFSALAAEEVRLWYRVEWSPSTTAIDQMLLHESREETLVRSSMTYQSGGAFNRYSGQMYAPNMCGTIQWIQRLRKEPDFW